MVFRQVGEQADGDMMDNTAAADVPHTRTLYMWNPFRTLRRLSSTKFPRVYALLGIAALALLFAATVFG
jgi:hypothetical protein